MKGGRGSIALQDKHPFLLQKYLFPWKLALSHFTFFFNQDLMYIYSVYLKLNFIYLFLNFGCAGSLLWHSSFSSCFTWA